MRSYVDKNEHDMETVLTIDREADGKLVISQSKNYITNTSISLSDKEIEVICSVYKRIKYNGKHPEDILKYICDLCNVPIAGLKSRNRAIKYTLPRQLYCYAARKLTTHSLSAIGAFINRDHATVNHSVKVIEVYQEIKYKKATDLVDNILNFFNDEQGKDNVRSV